MPLEGKEPAAQGGVTRRTVRNAGVTGREQLEFVIPGMNVVRQDTARADEVVTVVRVKVVTGVEQARNRLDFLAVFVEVRCKP